MAAPEKKKRPKHTMPPATAEQKAHVEEFLLKFDDYYQRIIAPYARVPLKDRPDWVKGQLHYANAARKAIKWMRDQNKKRKSPPQDLGQIGAADLPFLAEGEAP